MVQISPTVVAVGLIASLAISTLMIIFRRKIVYWVRHYPGISIYYLSRLTRSHPTIAIIALTAPVVWFARERTPIVIVTLFYATVLFFTNIFKRSQPYPILDFDTEYIGDEYGQSDSMGFKYEFTILNHGQVDLVDPTVEYRLYDSEYRLKTDGWESVPNTVRQGLNIEPGDSETFSVQDEPVSEDAAPDYIIAVRVRPHSPFRDVTKWWTRRVAANRPD